MLNPAAVFHIADDGVVYVPTDRQTERSNVQRVAAREYRQRDWRTDGPQWAPDAAVYEASIGDTEVYIPVAAVREITTYTTPNNLQ